MSEQDQAADAKTMAELERKIVKVPYSDTALHKTHTKKRVDATKVLRLAKKIRKTYDYDDITLNGTH